MTNTTESVTDEKDLEAYDQICQMVANGELCSFDGKDCELEDCQERYGDDADGNRGIWVYFKRCRKCGEEL
jgi:hypothetical protein